MSTQDLPPLPVDVGLPEDWLVIAPADGQILFRMVKHDPPIEDDFLSDRTLGRPRHPDDVEADHLGLSMFAEQAQAEGMMRRYPKLIAAVRLEAGFGFCLARTLPEVDGHHTVWGLPSDLAGRVDFVATIPEP